MVNLSKGCLIASNLQHVLKIFLFKNDKNNVQHVFVDLKIHFLKISRLMFCKATFINRWKGKCQKDFQHGQRTEEGLAAIQFGPLFSVSTIIIISIFVLIFFSVNTIIIILIFLMIFFWWYFSRRAPSSSKSQHIASLSWIVFWDFYHVYGFCVPGMYMDDIW